MKNFWKIFGLLTVILSFVACQKQSPAEYNDNIVKQQIAIIKKMTVLKNSINDYNILPADVAIENMNKAYDSLIFQIDTSTKAVKAMDPFKKDSTFKNAALDLFDSYHNVAVTKYKRVIELYKLPTNMFTEVESQELDSLKNQAAAEIDEAFAKFSEVQNDFAQKNNLNLIKK